MALVEFSFRPVPWPTGEGLVLEGATRLEILRKAAAMVRYRAGADVVTVVAMVPWDAPPRVIEVADGPELAVWWRKGRWTMIAVGPAATQSAWRKLIGAP